MTSPYIKAALLTLALTFLGFFFISQFDAMRATELRGSVDDLIYQSESERLLFLYAQTMGNGTELCAYFNSTTEASANRAYALAGKIRQYEESNVLNAEYTRIRDQYYLSNAALYLNLRSAEKYCGGDKYDTVLFFYKVKQNCPDCNAQGKVLDALRATHPNLRVFAFPTDTELPFIKLLSARHNITQVPSLAINDNTVLRGLQTDSQVEKYLGPA